MHLSVFLVGILKRLGNTAFNKSVELTYMCIVNNKHVKVNDINKIKRATSEFYKS